MIKRSVDAMTDTPSEEEKQDEDAFNAVLGRLVNTPHKPHKPPQSKGFSDDPRLPPDDVRREP